MYTNQQQPVYQQQPMMMQQQPVYQQQPMMMQQQPVYQQQPVMMQQQPMMMQQQQPMYGQPMMQQQPQVIINLQGPMPGQMGQPMNTGAQGKKGWDRIQDRDGIFIKQKFDMLEAMTGCEVGNTYYVFPLGKDGDKKGKKFYKAKEKSSCFAKQCMNADCRPFSLKVNLEDDDENLDNEPFLVLDRPCKCTCMCLDRPEMTVHYVEDGKNEYVGKIKDVWTCCNVVVEIHDDQGQIKYIVEASCCQLGFHCKGPFDACQIIDFEIKAPSGDVLATLQKRSAGCVAAMVGDATNFAVNFPPKATKEDKALIMSACLLLDYRHFEEKPQNGNNNRM